MVGVRIWLAGAVGAVAAVAAVAALLAWPRVSIATSGSSLARVSLPSFAGRVERVSVRAGGGVVPVRLARGEVWPRRRLRPGVEVSVDVAVRRPGWIGWLVGRSEHRRLVLRTPAATPRRWLAVEGGAPLTLAFSAPVALVRVGRAAPRRLAVPRMHVDTGIVRSGGSVAVAAAARVWETLPAPVTVHWFPARPRPQVLARPRAGGRIAPATPLTLVFSSPLREALGEELPRLSPATPGRWRRVDAHTLGFVPAGLGFGFGETVRVTLPRPVDVVGGAQATRTLRWRVPTGSTLRLQQLLARLGYLPLRWRPAADPPPSGRALLASVLAPPQGAFAWRFRGSPQSLRALWQPGRPSAITRGALMRFEDENGLPVDGLVGPAVWRRLLRDALAGRRHRGGYSYVLVRRTLPQRLELWHDGRVVVRSAANTGIAVAPTAPGTFPVFEHLAVTTMSGTNPDGTRYDDPGVRWVSYFNGGDALHAFPRASYGTPQSLGCVELPLGAAAAVWPYTPVGTLVTVE